MNNEIKTNSYLTSDFWIASTLMALGENLISLDRSNGHRVRFVFEYSGSLNSNVARYKAGEIKIEPQKLFVQTRLLKSRLYDDGHNHSSKFLTK